MIEPVFHKVVLQEKPNALPVYHLAIGAIGDIYHHLNFIRPVLAADSASNRHVVVFTYVDRYSQDAIANLCSTVGNIDTLLICSSGRLAAGSVLFPIDGGRLYQHYLFQNLYTNLTTNQYPVVALRCAAESPPVLQGVQEKYGLPNAYSVYQATTKGKDGMCVTPEMVKYAKRAAKTRAIVTMYDETPRLLRVPNMVSLGDIPFADFISIIQKATTFIGVESSQFMAAVLNRVPSVYLPSGQSLNYFIDNIPYMARYMTPFTADLLM